MRFCRLFLIVLLCSVVCIGLFSFSAFAAEYTFPALPDTGNDYWVIADVNGEIRGYNQPNAFTPDGSDYIGLYQMTQYNLVDGEWTFIKYQESGNFSTYWLIYDNIGVYAPSDSVTFLALPPPSIDDILGDIVNIFNSCISWVGSVGSTILDKPILLFYAALPLCGIGVGFFKRLKS